MTVTTTITISHEEMERLHLTDKSLEAIGYRLIKTTTFGKVFEKISWNMKALERIEK